MACRSDGLKEHDGCMGMDAFADCGRGEDPLRWNMAFAWCFIMYPRRACALKQCAQPKLNSTARFVAVPRGMETKNYSKSRTDETI